MNSIRHRLVFGLIALIIAVLTLAGIETYRRSLESANALLDHQLLQMALSLRDQGAVIQITPRPEDQARDFAIQIWDGNGFLIYASSPEVPFTGQLALGFSDVKTKKGVWRAYTLQNQFHIIQVALSMPARETLAREAALRTLTPLLILMPLLAIGIWWGVSRGLAPISATVTEIERRGADSLEPLSTAGLPSEIRPLAAEMNRLMSRLSAAFQGQRAFIADAAHELRSPLTALSVHLQLLDRVDDPVSRAETLERLRDATERARNLVEQLLTLARNEPDAQAAALTRLSLDATLREGVADCAALALARGTDLSLEAEATEIAGDEAGLRILARNLVDNALRYTPPGGRVIARLQNNILSVEDSGPGIPAEDRARVFDRFYRRTGSPEGGSGLGLAIVKAVADRHHAMLELGQSELGGLKVSVRFPTPDDRDVPTGS